MSEEADMDDPVPIPQTVLDYYDRLFFTKQHPELRYVDGRVEIEWVYRHNHLGESIGDKE